MSRSEGISALSMPRAGGMSSAGLLAAARRLGGAIVLPLAVVFAGSVTSGLFDSRWTVVVTGGGLAVATVVMARRRSVYLPIVAYFTAFQGWAVLWRLADNTGLPVRFDYVIALDRLVGLGTLPTAWLQGLYTPGSLGIHDVVLLGVYFSFFLVPHWALFLLWQRDRALGKRYAIALVGAAYLGLATMFVLPTAPPWMAGDAALIEPVTRIARVAIGDLSPGLAEQGYDLSSVNEVAAMPSLHMAATLLVAIGAVRAYRRLWPLAAAYTLTMGVSLVYLGEHYVVDLAAGALLALVAWRLAGRFVDRGDATPVLAERERLEPTLAGQPPRH